MRTLHIFFLLIAVMGLMPCTAQSYYEDDFFTYDDTYTSFQSRVGRIINSSEQTIGTFNRVTATVATVDDMTSKESISALRLQLESTGNYGYGEVIATIDRDEFDRLIESVVQIHDMLVTSGTKTDADYVYRSREGMAYGGSAKGGEVKQYVQLAMYNELSYIHLDESGYEEFLVILKKAKAKM